MENDQVGAAYLLVLRSSFRASQVGSVFRAEGLVLWEAGKWGSVSPAVKQRVLGESSVDLCSVLC